MNQIRRIPFPVHPASQTRPGTPLKRLPNPSHQSSFIQVIDFSHNQSLIQKPKTLHNVFQHPPEKELSFSKQTPSFPEQQIQIVDLTRSRPTKKRKPIFGQRESREEEISSLLMPYTSSKSKQEEKQKISQYIQLKKVTMKRLQEKLATEDYQTYRLSLDRYSAFIQQTLLFIHPAASAFILKDPQLQSEISLLQLTLKAKQAQIRSKLIRNQDKRTLLQKVIEAELGLDEWSEKRGEQLWRQKELLDESERSYLQEVIRRKQRK